MRALACVSTVAFLLTTSVSCEPDESKPAAPAEATAPAIESATTQTVTPLPDQRTATITFLDVVRQNYPTFPTTSPLAETLELDEAARLRISEPIYLCSRGDLWITRPDALPTPQVLAQAADRQTHVTTERVVFVYWRPDSPHLVVRERENDVWVTSTSRQPLDPLIQRDWSRARIGTLDEHPVVAVPTQTGLSILRIRMDDAGPQAIDEQHIDLTSASPGMIIHYTFGRRGLLAWSFTPTSDSVVARFVDGAWTRLSQTQDWPRKLLQVIPFDDGSVLAIGVSGETLEMKSLTMDSLPIDESTLLEQVRLLSNPDRSTREQAQETLVRIGPAAWPVLQRIVGSQPSEARVRIRAILADQTTPSLNGMTPEPGPARLVTRLRDGGVVLQFANGASAVTGTGVMQTFAPAWICIHPNAAAKRLPDSVIEHLGKSNASLVACERDAWVIAHEIDGPIRVTETYAAPLLTNNEAIDFRTFAGIDSAGRWLFKTIVPDGATLILDPTLPNPTPKLPVWTVDVSTGSAGWHRDGWAMIRRDGAWTLTQDSWTPLAPAAADQQMLTARPDTATPQAALMIDDAGNTYDGGKETLAITRQDGSQLTWPLPPEAIGEGFIGDQVFLIEAADKLFLANHPGRLIRLTRTQDNDTPFRIDAIFTAGIPTQDIRRIWKDPVGRIVIASKGSTLSICFPNGRVPKPLRTLIPAESLTDEAVRTAEQQDRPMDH